MLLDVGYSIVNTSYIVEIVKGYMDANRTDLISFHKGGDYNTSLGFREQARLIVMTNGSKYVVRSNSYSDKLLNEYIEKEK